MKKFWEKPAQKCSGGNTGNPGALLLLDVTRRCRCYPSFTSYLEMEPFYDETKVKYLVYGKEICPTTKKPHWQGFVLFYEPILYKHAQDILGIGSSHIENLLKTDMNNAIEYCMKDGDYKEFGIKPQQGHRTDLDFMKNRIMQGEKLCDIVLDNPMIYHQYGRTLEKIQDIKNRKLFRNVMTKGIWYWGKTGIGKSAKAFENFNPDTFYVKNVEEEFWDGYDGHKTVIINEFRGQIKFSELLDLCDWTPKYVKIKGKAPVPFLAETIIITSALHPNEVYAQSLHRNDRMEQFDRRFNVIELTQNS